MSEDTVVKFSSAEVQLVLHATEGHDKVLAAVEKALSVPAASFGGEQSEGHYGNAIMLLGAVVSSSKEAGALASRIISALNHTDRQELTDHIEEYSDEKGNLYLRLDKQRLCQGKVSLAESDAVRVKFKPVHRYKPSSSLQSYRGLLSSIE
ncbi:putative exosome subunit [Candidatus Nitrososphaera evergladensis SR1]|jgi:RNA binding exosome subunit|uniref:Putative exosome subunit n=1 Tax=Candidatus Nitrososphaera evergladensis SR1 TaxID=1459636 RepID=A0A075MX12_9ARCH|nr:RNA-binding domain-containing protein [Candidatus Nitrososphaera evergladensis]AIF83819.1 putative exosome subunit [Candidatus Nitrososphaera evergladensis SR1]